MTNMDSKDESFTETEKHFTNILIFMITRYEKYADRNRSWLVTMDL